MKSYSEDLLKTVGELTGINDDSKLHCITGAVYATVFLGKMPIKEDLANFLGVSKRTVMATIREASVYPLAATCSLRGLYIGTEEEPYTRAVAREYLAKKFDPESIVTVKEYVGYDITLEYLWQVADGAEESIDDYIRSRFEPGFKIKSKLQAFALLVYQSDADMALSDYAYVIKVLAEGVRRAYNEALENGSANKAKKRLRDFIKSDHQ